MSVLASTDSLSPAAFEAVCQQLNRNPAEATRVLHEFKESNEYAFEASLSFLQSPICSAMSKFQACSILQHVSLNRRWTTFTTQQKLDVRVSIWNLILQGCQSPEGYPPYLLNKLMQTSALIWKRSWMDLSSDNERYELFSQQLALLLQGDRSYLRFGSIYLRMIVEEFSSYRSTEIVLPLEFHKQTHLAFEGEPLSEAMRMAWDNVFASFRAYSMSVSDSNELIFSGLQTVNEACSMLTEILYWDFGAQGAQQHQLHSQQSNGVATKENDRYNQLLGSFPDKWIAMLETSEHINHVFDAYLFIRELTVRVSCVKSSGVRSPDGSSGTGSEILESQHSNCLIALLNIIIAVSSILFESKVKMCETIGQKLVFLLSSVLSAAAAAAAGSSSTVGSSGSSSTSRGGAYEVLVKEKEGYHLAIAVQKFFSNYSLDVIAQTSQFESLIMNLAHMTLHVAGDLAQLAESYLQQRFQMNARGGGRGGSYGDTGTELIGLDSWRVECIMLFLQGWSNILDNELMFPWQPQKLTHYGVDVTPLKGGLQSIGYQVFVALYQSILKSTLFESLTEGENSDNEEDDDQEAIQERSFDDVVAAISTVGRSSFVNAARFIVGSLSEVHQRLTASLQAGQAPSIELLETIRITVIFGAHLCDDSFSSSDTSSSSESSTSSSFSSETPVVPSFILDSFVNDAAGSAGALHALVTVMGQHLQSQLGLLTQASSLASPVVIVLLLRFFSSYLVRYCDIDPALYDKAVQTHANGLFRLHEGTDLHGVLDLLMQGIKLITATLPLENHAISAVSELLVVFSRLTKRHGFLCQHAACNDIYASLCSVQQQQSPSASLSRFAGDGITAMARALAFFAARTQDPYNYFPSLCGYLIHRTDHIMQSKLEIEQCIACIRGLSCCMIGNVKMIHSLFDSFIPALLQHKAKTVSSHDDVLKAVIVMLRDYAENQISVVSKPSATTLYAATYSVLEIASHRLNRAAAAVASSSEEQDELEYRSEIILALLQLLNHLSTRDFLVVDSDEPTDQQQQQQSMGHDVSMSAVLTINGLSFEQLVSKVLMFGFVMFVPVMSADFLRSFPNTCNRYFSFVSFLVSVYEVEFAELIVSSPSIFSRLADHLLWGVGVIDSVVSRMALQVIQAMATHQYQCMKQGAGGYGLEAASQIFPYMSERLFGILMFPHLSDYGVSWDRIDPCANALFALIVLDQNTFLASAQKLIQSQAAMMHQALIASFSKLTTDRGIVMTKLDRQNRQVFVLNMRDFFKEVQPLILYRQ